LYKWDDTSSDAHPVTIVTKDFDFGNPAARKKCFKFYITYKCDGTYAGADTNVEVYYGTNGIDLTGNTLGTEVDTDSVFAGTSDVCYGSNGLRTTGGQWKQAELKPSTSVNNKYSIQLKFHSVTTVDKSFAINDITIIYRQKPLK